MTDERKKWAGIVAAIRSTISKKEDELDDAGIERKALDVTPELVDDLREKLCAAFPAMCEGEGEAIAEVMQVVTDTLAEAQPSSDVAEERAADDEDEKQDEDEDEEKNSAIAALTQQVADMGKEYTELIKDVSDVVQFTQKALETMSAEKKSQTDFSKRLADIEKKIGERPRRASQSPETKLDPKSKLATDLKQRDLSDVPDAYKDMFEGVSS